MPPQNNPDRIRILFDDHRLVANAGLLLPATLVKYGIFEPLANVDLGVAVVGLDSRLLNHRGFNPVLLHEVIAQFLW